VKLGARVCRLLFALFALAARSADAEPAERPVLVVQMAADRDDAVALERVLRELSGRAVQIDVAVVPHIEPGTVIRGSGADRAHPPLARVFLDLSDPARVTIHVVDGAWQRILVRHVSRSSSPDVVRETVGRIVSTAVEALLAGSFSQYSEPVTIEVPRPAAPPERPGASAPESERRTLAGRVGVMYEVDLDSRGPSFVHGPALYGALGLRGAVVRPTFWVTAQYRWPVVEDGPPIGYRLDTTALRLLGGAEIETGSISTLELAVGAGLDIVQLEPRRVTADESTWVAAPRSLVIGVARVMAGARWRLGRSLSAHTAFVADIDASRTRLIYQASQGGEAIRAPYSVRPGFVVAVSVP
jgi:hypothetical protein